MKVIQPEGWPRPKGYSNAIEANGRTIYIAGLIGWNEREEFEAKDLPGQFEQILKNLVVLLAEADAGPEHVVRMTWYVTSKREYIDNLRAIGASYRKIMGAVFPVMAVVQVVELMEDDAKIEIEVTAVVPD